MLTPSILQREGLRRENPAERRLFLGQFCLKPAFQGLNFAKNAPFSGFKALFQPKIDNFFDTGHVVVANRRLRRGFYSYFCYLWLYCHELNLRNLVISGVLPTLIQISLCLAWPGRPVLCPKMLKTRASQVFSEGVLHVWLPLARKSRYVSGFGHFV